MWATALSFRLGPEHWTQLAELDGKCLHLPSHLSGPLSAFLNQGLRYKQFMLKAKWPHTGIKRWGLWEVMNVPKLEGRFTRHEICQHLRT